MRQLFVVALICLLPCALAGTSQQTQTRVQSHSSHVVRGERHWSSSGGQAGSQTWEHRREARGGEIGDDYDDADLGQQTEVVSQQDFGQQSADLGQQTEDLRQEAESLRRQSGYSSQQSFGQQSSDLGQESEDLGQQTEDLGLELEALQQQQQSGYTSQKNHNFAVQQSEAEKQEVRRQEALRQEALRVETARQNTLKLEAESLRYQVQNLSQQMQTGQEREKLVIENCKRKTETLEIQVSTLAQKVKTRYQREERLRACISESLEESSSFERMSDEETLISNTYSNFTRRRLENEQARLTKENVELRAQLASQTAALRKEMQDKVALLEKDLQTVTTNKQKCERAVALKGVKKPTVPLVNLGGNYYYFHRTSKMTWRDAGDYCRSQGLHLAIIDNKQEDDLISAEISDREMHWIDGNDIKNEGKFVWESSGAPIVYTHWQTADSKEPNDKNHSENCIFIGRWGSSRSVMWLDAPCGWGHFFVCEQPN